MVLGQAFFLLPLCVGPFAKFLVSKIFQLLNRILKTICGSPSTNNMWAFLYLCSLKLMYKCKLLKIKDIPMHKGSVRVSRTLWHMAYGPNQDTCESKQYC